MRLDSHELDLAESDQTIELRQKIERYAQQSGQDNSKFSYAHFLPPKYKNKSPEPSVNKNNLSLSHMDHHRADKSRANKHEGFYTNT